MKAGELPDKGQEHLARLSRARQVLVWCNHALVHASSEPELLQQMCRIVVEVGGYRQAWIAVPVDDPAKSIAVAATAGYENDPPRVDGITWAEDGGYQGATGRVIATGQPYIARDILHDDAGRRRERALARGYQSSATLPLFAGNRCIGAISIYAREPGAFDADEIALIKTLAQDISYGVGALRLRAAHEQAEIRSLAVEERFRATFEQAAVGMAHTMVEGRFFEVNRKLCEILGYSREELLALTTRGITHPDDRGSHHNFMLDLLAGKISVFSDSRRYVRKDEGVIWLNRTVALSRPAGGEPYLIQVIEDITERKRDELNLKRVLRARRVMAEVNHVLVHAVAESALLQETCRILVETGGYCQAWVGLAEDDAEKSIRIGGEAGCERQYLDAHKGTWADDDTDHGVMGHVIATGAAYTSQNILADGRFLRRRERAIKRGYQSAITLPLKIEGRCIGGLSIYAFEPDAFDADEITLLDELAEDLAYGIKSFRARRAHARAEAMAQENEERFRETFNQAAVGIVHTAPLPDRHYLLVNQKFCDMVGYTFEELKRMNGLQLSHPDDLDSDRGLERRLIKGEITTYASPKRYIRKDGGIIWVNRTVSLVRDSTGKPKYFIRVIEDITGRKEVEEDLRLSEERFRTVFSHANVGITVSSLDLRYLQVNDKYCEMIGYQGSELMQMGVRDVILHGDVGETVMLRKQLVSGEINSYYRERQLLRKDGTTIWVSLVSSMVRGNNGEPQYFVSVIQDMSERKRAEAALLESEEQLRAMFNQASVGITVSAFDMHYIQVNDKYCDIVGYSRDELLRMSVGDVNIPENMGDALEYRRKLFAGETQDAVREKELLRKDGSRVWVSMATSVIRDDSGKPKHFISVIQDISERRQAVEALRASEETLRATNAHLQMLIQSSPLAIYTRDTNGLLTSWNPAAEKMYGWKASEVLNKSLPSVSDEQRADSDALRMRLLAGEPFIKVEARRSRRDGSPIDIDAFVGPLRDVSGNVTGIIAMVADISDRKRAELALRESEEKFRQMADNIPEVFWMADVGMRKLLYLSPVYEKVTGKPAAEAMKRLSSFLEIVHPDDKRRVRMARRAMPRGSDYNIEYRILCADGSLRWIHEQAYPVRDGEGRIYRIAGIAADITQRKAAEEKLVYLAHYDGLTGLPNRVLFRDRLEQTLAQARRRNWLVGVMMLDLDRFKVANDSLGHSVGDSLLKQVAGRLTGCVRVGDTVGRFGGDEFGVILSDLRNAEDARLVAQKALDAFAEPFQLERDEVYITASIGISMYPADSDDLEVLIKSADTALHRAKDSGRNNFQFFTGEMNAKVLHRLSMENSLRRALERHEFLLHYQPKASLNGGNTTGLEALLRWQHPELGLVLPGEFVPLLEETGLIIPVGEWIFSAVCAQLKAWAAAGVQCVPIAINLSSRQFLTRGFGSYIRRLLDEYEADPRLIELEITESSLMANTEDVVHTLEYLESIGVRISVDDFGTGYSSLSYLKRFPLDALKIDRSFVRDITSNAEDATIVRAIISMAGSLGLKVVAEGVETEAQMSFLATNGCDEIQGYYLSRPLTVEDCGAWLQSNVHLSRPAALRGTAPALLLVDDDEDMLILLMRELSQDGYYILTAHDAAEGFDILSRHRVDMVISDHQMPGMSGVEFLQRVKSLYPDTVRIMCSGLADFQTMTEAVNKGEIFRFLPKNMDQRQMRREVHEALSAPRTSVQARGDARRSSPGSGA